MGSLNRECLLLPSTREFPQQKTLALLHSDEVRRFCDMPLFHSAEPDQRCGAGDSRALLANAIILPSLSIGLADARETKCADNDSPEASARGLLSVS